MSQINKLAPIALFVYSRPDHTLRTLQALQENNLAKESDLFVFCDGPKNENAIEGVKKVHEIVDNISGFKSIKVEKSDVNKGLANSIISGVSKIVNQYGKIIVVEDDLVTSPYFLQFMNDGLEFYKNNEKVISIHGYIYPLKAELPETFFLRGADCWGWATWKRGWDLFEKNGANLLLKLRQKNLTKEFDFDRCYPFTKMLEDQVAGRNDSWAIRWHAAAFLANKLTLYPGKTLVENIGADGSGTHCADMKQFDVQLNEGRVFIEEIPLIENLKAREEIKKFFKPKKNLFIKYAHKITKKLQKRKAKKKSYGWFSTSLSWSEIIKEFGGYDNQKILEKCKNALLKVKNGEAVFERDSVNFTQIEYSWPVLSGLFLAAAENKGRLDIIDFGGSLGSCYFQNRKFLAQLKEVKWNIVEQPNFVKCGKDYFENSQLKFYYDIESCQKETKSNALLLSSVIQYIEKPYDFLDEIISKKIEFFIFDLTGFSNDDTDLLTVQKVWPDVYEASYPCWFFSKTKFFAKILEKYELIEEFPSHFGQEISIDGVVRANYCGAILKLKTDA